MKPLSQALVSICAVAAVVGCDVTDTPRSAAVPVAPATPGTHEPEAASVGSAGVPSRGPISFVDVTDRTGIDFVHATGTSEEKPFPAANGSGVAALDFDLDGRQDLYFATGTPFPVTESPGSRRNRLYRNRGGLRFEAVDRAGLDVAGYSAGLAVGDFDADGFPDIHVACFGADRLFRNCGDGTYAETGDCGDPRWGASSAFLDADGDGLLDLYVCNYAKWTPETNAYCGDPGKGVRIYCSPRSVEPEPHSFFRNAGDGGFVEDAAGAGLGGRAGRGQGVLAADLDGDRKTDLYVANDQNPNFLFLGRDGGVFEDATEASGAAYDSRGNTQAGMGVDVADVDGDGLFDLFVTNYADESNALYRQFPRGNFNDIGQSLGLAAPSLPWVGWGTALADFDADGRPDVVVTNGHTDDNLHALGREGDFEQPPLLFHNEGGRFAEVAQAAGGYFRGRHVGRALAVVDLNDDFLPDLVIGHQDGPPAVLVNRSVEGGERPRLRLRTVGTTGNRDGYGATFAVVSGGTRRVHPVRSGGSYLSASDPRSVAAAPSGSCDLEVSWPWGGEQRVEGLAAGGDYLIIEPRHGDFAPRILRLTPSTRRETTDERLAADYR